MPTAAVYLSGRQIAGVEPKLELKGCVGVEL